MIFPVAALSAPLPFDRGSRPAALCDGSQFKWEWGFRPRSAILEAGKTGKDRRIDNWPVLVCDHHAERDRQFEVATAIDSPIPIAIPMRSTTG